MPQQLSKGGRAGGDDDPLAMSCLQGCGCKAAAQRGAVSHFLLPTICISASHLDLNRYEAVFLG